MTQLNDLTEMCVFKVGGLKRAHRQCHTLIYHLRLRTVLTQNSFPKRQNALCIVMLSCEMHMYTALYQRVNMNYITRE